MPHTASDNYILYAEDNVTDYTFFERAFKKVSPRMDLKHVANGKLARNFLLQQVKDARPLPRALVLDIKMPGLTGLELLKYIREQDALHNLPVIILSASEERRDMEEAYAQRTNAYLVKPGRYSELRQMVQTIAEFWLHFNRIPT